MPRLKTICVIAFFALVIGGNFAQDHLKTLRQQAQVGSQASAATNPANCQLVKRPVQVYLDPARYPMTVAHAQRAIVKGQPVILHLDRAHDDQNRADDLAGIPTKPGYDRDEYAPAVSRESAGGKADVQYVPSSDNRGAGSSMGAQLGDYCNGQAFKMVFTAAP